MKKFVASQDKRVLMKRQPDCLVSELVCTGSVPKHTDSPALSLVPADEAKSRGKGRGEGRIKDGLFFLARAIRAPRKVGALIPSGNQLGRTMAKALPEDGEVYVELGGGTGSLTKAILESGIPEEKLIVVERDPHFVALLRRRFPRVLVIEGDGQELGRILKTAGISQVCAVLSGLPLKSLPKATVRKLTEESFSVLKPGGSFVQFTYWGDPSIPADILRSFDMTSRKVGHVWRNLPPAHVWCYRRPEQDKDVTVEDQKPLRARRLSA